MSTRWSCPHCGSVWNVADSMTGKMKCPKCSRTTTHNSPESFDPGLALVDEDGSVSSRPNQSSLIAAAVNSRAKGIDSTIILLALLIMLLLAAAVFVGIKGGVYGILLGSVAVGSLLLLSLILSPIFEAANELHRCRKLLEIIAHRSDQ